MPLTVMTQQERDGELLRVEIRRQSDGGVGLEIEVVEIDRVNGVPESSRRRIFSEEQVTVPQREALRALFNQIESRIKAVFYT